jgi:hypothetical protein
MCKIVSLIVRFISKILIKIMLIKKFLQYGLELLIMKTIFLITILIIGIMSNSIWKCIIFTTLWSGRRLGFAIVHLLSGIKIASAADIVVGRKCCLVLFIDICCYLVGTFMSLANA